MLKNKRLLALDRQTGLLMVIAVLCSPLPHLTPFFH